jgi:TM2 domain-containing membrane protein YozV
MKTAIKAALLSGVVFPGLGQIYLKRYKRGLVILILVLLGFVIIIRTVIVSALESLKEIQSGGGIADMETISNLARIDSAHSGINLNFILLLVSCCWLFSAVDAYRIGKRSLPGIDDKKKLSENPDQQSQ